MAGDVNVRVGAWPNIEDLLRDCTVRITAGDSFGTGFFVAPGLILTCAHVVEAVEAGSERLSIWWRVTATSLSTVELGPYAPNPYPDLALLHVTGLTGHPCVLIDPSIEIGDALYGFGYPLNYERGDSALFEYEGPAWESAADASQPAREYLRLKFSQATAGFSGGPLLNRRTGAVCGIVKRTRDPDSDLGARAIPAATILRWHPDLVALQTSYHDTHREWTAARDSREPKRAAAVVFAPPPVPGFVPRRKPADALIEWLTRDEGSGAADVVVLHGLPGSGKTSLARAMANDPLVQQHFTGGILWTTLGQEPDVLRGLLDWIEVLGGDSRADDDEAASRDLAALVRKRERMLAVIDDGWDAGMVKPFIVGASKCKTLITARRAHISDDLQADLVDLGPMTTDEALALLEARLGRPLLETEQGAATDVAAAVGCLPAAIDLAAARVRRGTPWTELVSELERDEGNIEALEAGRSRRLGQSKLEQMVDISLRTVRAEDPAAYEAFLRLGVLFEDAEIAAPAAAVVCGMPQDEAGHVLEFLCEDALLLPAARTTIAGRQWPAYRMHDVLRHVARRLLTGPVLPSDPATLPGLGIDIPSAHRELLDRYGQRTHHGQWHTLPDDGYIHQQLVYHFDRAGRSSALHALLAECDADRRNAWYEQRERLRQSAGYLADLRHARGLVDPPASAADASLACRYALIAASLSSLAGSIPNPLMVRLVELDRWSVPQALSYIQRLPHRSLQTDALAALGPHLKPSSVARAAVGEPQLDESGWDWHWVKRVATLTPFLDESSRGVLLRRACDQLLAGTNLYDMMADSSIASLAPHLPEPILVRMSQGIGAMHDCYQQAQAATALAPSLPEHLARALLVDVPDAAPALVARLAALGFAGDAVRIARSLQPEWRMARALEMSAPHLSASSIGKALVGANKLSNPAFRAGALIAIAGRLAGLQRVEEAMRWAARAIREEDCRGNTEWWMRAALAVAPHASPELQQRLLDELKATGEREEFRARFIKAIAPSLTESLARETLADVERFSERTARNEARAALLGRLAVLGPVLPVVELASAVDDSAGRGSAIAAVARHASGKAVGRALDVIASLESGRDREAAVAAIAPRLSDRDVTIALEIVRGVRDRRARVSALVDLLPYLPVGPATRILDAVAREPDEKTRLELLQRHAKELPHGCFERALEIAFGFADNTRVDLVLEALVPLLPESGWRSVFERICSMSDAKKRADLLATLATSAPDTAAAHELLAAATRAGGSPDLEIDLAGRFLELGDAAAALQMVESLRRMSPPGGVYYAARALDDMAARLDEPALTSALQLATSLLNDLPDAGLNPVARLAARCAELGRLDTALSLLRQVRDGVERLLAPQPDGSSLASVPHVPAWPDALVSVAKMNPSIEVQRELSELASQTRSARDRAAALTAVAPYLDEPPSADAIEEMVDEPPRTPAFRLYLMAETIQLAGLLPADRRDRLIANGMALCLENQRADSAQLRFFEAAARWMDADLLTQALRMGMDAEGLGATHANTALLHRLVELHGPAAAFGRIADAPWRRDSGTLLAALAPSLPAETLVEAAEASLMLRTAASRRKALLAIAPRLARQPSDLIAGFLHKLLAAEGNRLRPDLLENLGGFGAAFAGLGAPSLAEEVATAIEDVGRWWP
jgi:hypothetical protein